MSGPDAHAELLARPYPRSAAILLRNFRDYLRSSGSRPHRCKVWRESPGKWTWICLELRCGGDTWLSSQEAAFAVAFGHASGLHGPYPYRVHSPREAVATGTVTVRQLKDALGIPDRQEAVTEQRPERMRFKRTEARS